MTRKKKRLTLIAAAMVVLGTAAGLVLYALRDNIVFFYGPSEIVAKDLPPGTHVRSAASSNKARSNAMPRPRASR